jgi:hypothetical protein
MVISAIADGDVVRVPKSLTDLTPRILSRNGSLGTFFGGAEAAKAKGSVDLRMSEKESESKIVSTVFRVPPLGPELLHRVVRDQSNCMQVRVRILHLLNCTSHLFCVAGEILPNSFNNRPS